MSGDGWHPWGGLEQLPEPEPFSPRDFRPAQAGLRNGLPPLRPYTWRPGDAEREAEVQARIAAVRAQLRRRKP